MKPAVLIVLMIAIFTSVGITIAVRTMKKHWFQLNSKEKFLRKGLIVILSFSVLVGIAAFIWLLLI